MKTKQTPNIPEQTVQIVPYLGNPKDFADFLANVLIKAVGDGCPIDVLYGIVCTAELTVRVRLINAWNEQRIARQQATKQT